MPCWLDADHVILSGLPGVRLSELFVLISATTTLEIDGGMGATTVNVPLTMEVSPIESVDVIV